jgi:hypothetical protein
MFGHAARQHGIRQRDSDVARVERQPPLIARLSRVYSSVRASIRNVVGQFTYEA